MKAKKKLPTNKSGVFSPKKTVSRTEPTTKNKPFSTDTPNTHGQAPASKFPRNPERWSSRALRPDWSLSIPGPRS